MKVVILAGGLGTRLAEETNIKPKPMVEIGGMPILWHIMKIYSSYGFNDFVICLGYKGEIIKEWFARYHMSQSDITFDFTQNKMTYHQPLHDPWKVTLVDTGAETLTGGRLLRLRSIIGNERFMMTYGDGVSDVNIRSLVEHHEKYGRIGTLTTVLPEGRFGVVEINSGEQVLHFSEKTDNKKRINGGFFVLEPKIFDYLTDGDETIFEQTPLQTLAHEGQLTSYPHNGFWHPMDTLRDKKELEELWLNNPKWKVW